METDTSEGDERPQPEGKQKKGKPFSVNLEVDFMQMLLFAVTLATRTYQLGLPRAVVFDELHFAKFVSLYLRRFFFFDVHPPLGKLILALAGKYTGFEGDVGFDRIGEEFSASFPVQQLRLVPALFGSLVVPLVYQIAVELGFSRWTAMLAATFILLDNALLVQSRFMLMEGMLLCFLCLSLVSFLKFRNLNHRQFSLQWWFWLCLTGVSFTMTLSVKYVGFFTCLLILYLAVRDYWKMLSDFSLSDLSLLKHLASRCVMLVAVPIAIYLYIFYVHLSILTKAGPHDNIMTSAFQASLEGGLAVLTQGQPLFVAYGSQITLRHTYDPSPGKPCWLHSHAHVYPVKYPDGRGSSHQQQVTCYVYKDVHNWWIVKNPDRDEMAISDPPEYVKHGDIVQLVHGITSRALNSHDVAAPVSPQLQEVSCYINYNVSMPAQNQWRVEILNRADDSSKWETIRSHVRFVHTGTKQALMISGKQLPEWGFSQLEVATDRLLQQQSTVWNVEEHRIMKNEDKDKQIKEITAAEMIPTEPTQLSFWEKFFELQFKMLFNSHDMELEHSYSSTPLEWPMMTRNVAYWMSGNSNAQIHLLGNIVVWIAGTVSVLIYTVFLGFYLLRRRRKVFDLTSDEWGSFLFTWDLIIVGYLLHYLPHFLTDRTLFLHHYLPCVIFKVLAIAAVMNHLELWLSRIQYGSAIIIYIIVALIASAAWVFDKISILSYISPEQSEQLQWIQYGSAIISYIIVALIASAAWVFDKISILSYGNKDISPEQLEQLQWLESWDFLQHKT